MPSTYTTIDGKRCCAQMSIMRHGQWMPLPDAAKLTGEGFFIARLSDGSYGLSFGREEACVEWLGAFSTVTSARQTCARLYGMKATRRTDWDW